jgi:hypothetical protein
VTLAFSRRRSDDYRLRPPFDNIRFMTDYYPLIVRAIAGLDPDAPGESRRALYERARAALVAQLRGVEPPLSESEITSEQLALEDAVRKVEAEAAQTARDHARTARQQGVTPDSDPLAELARLIGQTDPFNDLGRTNPPASSSEQSTEFDDGLPPGPPSWVRRARERTAHGRPPTLSITAIPEQNLITAIGFNPTREGPLDLIRDPPTDPYDKEQSELYARIRKQLKKLKEEIPSQERSQVNDAIDDFLDNHPDDWSKVEYKKLVWLSGNSLRTLLARHDSVKGDPEHYSKLPPSVAEALRNPVQAWSVFVQGDRQMALLDCLGPGEQQQVRENLRAAEQVVSIASHDRRIVTERAAGAIDSTMKSASVESTDVNTKLAQELAD